MVRRRCLDDDKTSTKEYGPWRLERGRSREYLDGLTKAVPNVEVFLDQRD